MNHTKGEWKARKSAVGDWVIETDGELICREARHYNAHLLAASPALYEALKLYQKHQAGTRGHYCGKCHEAINKALAKAEGK
uniref:Uncharacterized protein n=1 Tax=viral metagenome TaxID=1070528 RepID=A0A6M3KJJ9_9ZZZZ